MSAKIAHPSFCVNNRRGSKEDFLCHWKSIMWWFLWQTSEDITVSGSEENITDARKTLRRHKTDWNVHNTERQTFTISFWLFILILIIYTLRIVQFVMYLLVLCVLVLYTIVFKPDGWVFMVWKYYLYGFLVYF